MKVDRPWQVTERLLTVPPSPIRNVISLSLREGMISLAGGWPNPELFDADGLIEAADQVLTSTPHQALQYGQPEGPESLRVELAALCRGRGMAVSPSDIVVTTGAQQAIDLLTRVVLSPGDVVLVERPTYASALTTFRVHGARVVGVECDSDGMVLSNLSDAFERQVQRGRRPRMLYTVPNFANPTSVMTSAHRRAQLAAFCQANRLVVVEDDPYGDLYFSERAPLPVASVLHRDCWSDNESFVYVSSLSKIVSPGIRVGWCVLPPAMRTLVTMAKGASDLQGSSLDQYIAAQYLRSGRLTAHAASLRESYRRRCEMLGTALREFCGQLVTFDQPLGGMFLWGHLSPEMDAAQHLSAAASKGVVYVPGAGFYSDRPQRESLRLSFATPAEESLREGARRLAKSLNDCDEKTPS